MSEERALWLRLEAGVAVVVVVAVIAGLLAVQRTLATREHWEYPAAAAGYAIASGMLNGQ